MNVTGTGFGDHGKELSFDFVEEVEVKTGGLPAEYGRTTGGILNVLTKSGGNEFHGAAFGFFAGGGLQSDNGTAGRRPTDVTAVNDTASKYDLGASLGGRIVRDRLWFFSAFNRVAEDSEITVIRDLKSQGAPGVGSVVNGHARDNRSGSSADRRPTSRGSTTSPSTPGLSRGHRLLRKPPVKTRRLQARRREVREGPRAEDRGRCRDGTGRGADLDFERALWTIPPEATKTGEITGEPHVVPLSAGALQILGRRRGQKVAPLSPYVFPAPSGGYLRHPHRAIPALRAQSDVVDFRLHDVRRTVSQRIAEEFGEGMSHSILGHARQRLGRTYIPNRPLKEQRDGLEWWSAELSRLLVAEKGEPARPQGRGMSFAGAGTTSQIPSTPGCRSELQPPLAAARASPLGARVKTR